jgi:signal transduction histidine kinase
MMGGEIHLQSESGKGAEFILEFNKFEEAVVSDDN